MSALVWSDEGDFYYSDELSSVLRTNVQPLTKFRQFCDAMDLTRKGLHRGDTYRWNRYGDVAVQGRALAENQEMPQTSFSADQAELLITEYGNSVPYTGKLEKLSKVSVVNIIEKALTNDARKAFDIAAWTQFERTLARIVPTGGTATDSITLTVNGTPGATNNVAFGADHAKAISDMMSERNVPPFKGDDYIAITHPTTIRPLKNDLETINQYTDQGMGRIYRGEVGKYEGFRWIEQNQIPKGGADDTTSFDPYTRTADAWNNGKSSWIYFFGADTVGEALVIPEMIMSKIPTDFGRSKAIAWYALTGFGIVHDGASDTDQIRIFKWDSAA